MAAKKPTTIDDYIAGFPKGTQKILNQIRSTIKKAAPGAEEKISYAIPAFTLDKMNLIYFAAYAKHIGIYPAPVGEKAFKEDFSPYKTGKGTVQFPLDEPMPLDLLAKIVKYRARINHDKALKRSLRTCKNGHKYYKSSDCPTCPVCEEERKPKEGFFSILSAPARRALENNNIKNLRQLSQLTEKEVLGLHGMGKSSIPKLQEALGREGLDFKK